MILKDCLFVFQRGHITLLLISTKLGDLSHVISETHGPTASTSAMVNGRLTFGSVQK